ncbi:lipopolysaccharide biosynthesis protein [Wenyingzhuangia sp. IMCC45574]
MTLTIIPSVFAFSDLGFGSAAANSFVLAYASGDKQKAANIRKSGLKIISKMLIIAITLSVLVLCVLGYNDVFEKSLINAFDATVAVSVLILARFLNFYIQLIDSLYIAARKASLSINLKTVKSLLSVISGMLVLLLGYGVIAFSLSQLVVIILFNLFYWYKGSKLLDFGNVEGVVDNVETKNITKKGLGYMLFPGWQAIYFQGTTFVIRIVLGPEAVAVFNTVRTLSRSVNQVLNIVSSSIFPELQFEIGAGNKSKATKIYSFCMIFSLLLAFLGVLFLAFFGIWFYGVWTQKQLYLEPTIWYVFLVGILFNAIWWSSEPVFRAKNEPYQFAIAGIVSAIISVVMTYFFALNLNLLGAAIGSVTLDVLMAVMIIPKSLKLMKMSLKDIFISFQLSNLQLKSLLGKK